MVDAILDHLFKVGDLKVISRTSSTIYKNSKLPIKQIANELGVSSILEGSVQKIGNKVRITVQLIDPKTDFHLWSETFDRDLSDVFSIQSEVAINVARTLKATLTSKETEIIQNNLKYTTNQLSYNLYLKGRDYYKRADHLNAINMFTKAIQEDTLFTLAYSQRARSYMYTWFTKIDGWQGHDSLAFVDLNKAMSLNPELPELKLAQAYYFYWIKQDYDNAIRITDELKTESPNIEDLHTCRANILRRQGKMEESIEERKQTLLVDPFNASQISELASTYLLLHYYDDALQCASQGLFKIPDYKNFNYIIFDAYLCKTSDLNTALKESGLSEKDVQYQVSYYNRDYENLISFIRNDSAIISKQISYQPKTYRLALIYYLSNNAQLCKTYADSAIKELYEEIKRNPYDERIYATLGKSYALAGNPDEAVSFGQKAVNLKSIKLDVLKSVSKEQDLMEIYIITGNFDRALNMIERLLSIPSYLHISDIKLNPLYDPLRNIPRFQEIIANAQNNLTGV